MTTPPTPGPEPVPPRPEIAVGAVVIHQERLLLIERGRGPAKGQWSVPGGRVEWGETLAQAVEREVREETGLTVTCGPCIGWVERIGDSYHYLILDFQATATDPADPLRAGDDASAAAWVPLADLGRVELVAGLHQFLAEHDII